MEITKEDLKGILEYMAMNIDGEVSENELEHLRNKYTPEQLDHIQAVYAKYSDWEILQLLRKEYNAHLLNEADVVEILKNIHDVIDSDHHVDQVEAQFLQSIKNILDIK